LAVLNWKDSLKALIAEGIEAIVFRTVGDQPSLWESLLPEEVRRLPEELARVDALLDVNGHLELPTGGHRNCPLVANKNCPVADMNLPMREWPPPVVLLCQVNALTP
jgi:hypothetical protein